MERWWEDLTAFLELCYLAEYLQVLSSQPARCKEVGSFLLATDVWAHRTAGQHPAISKKLRHGEGVRKYM